MSCYYSSSAANGARDNAEKALREAKALRKEFEKMQRDQAEILANQKKLLEAFAGIADAVREMREDMYPSVKNTKPKLKPASRKIAS
jgi:predicted proteasome-type protease